MKIAALFSGGKDSAYAAYLAGREHELVCLITIIPEKDDSYMFHFPNIKLTKVQAEAMRLPLIFKKTKGEKEKELTDLKKAIIKAIEKYKIKGIVCGAIKSNYQKERVQKICTQLNLKLISPLWHVDEKKYLEHLIENKFKIIITGVAAEGLSRKFLGKEINRDLIDRFKKLNKKFKFHLSGEGGEYETFVVECPLFRKKIEIKKAEIRMENKNTGLYLIKNVNLK